MAQSNIKSMSVQSLLQLRANIDKVLSAKRADLESQLAALSGDKIGNRRGARRGMKVAPKYRSRKDPKLLWSGRGVTPVWMREEMKGGKLKKDAFLIK